MMGPTGPRGPEQLAAGQVAARPVVIVLHAGSRLLVPADGLAIGRGAANDVVIAKERVSREHARIYAADDGYWIADLDTKNGTYLNGERLRAAPRRLANGDLVTIGDETLRILAGEETRGAPGELAVREAQTVQLSGERLAIGRDPGNDVVLDDPNVSRFHAEVGPGVGGTELIDLGSRNGTRVNGELVPRTVLATGSEIGIGPFRLTFDGSNLVARDEGGALRLDAEDVSVRVKGKLILASTSMAIEPGEFVALIGESGSGKSTLMKALAGVRAPSEGVVTVNGEPVRTHLTDIGYVPQDEIVHARLTVVEALGYAARLRLPPDSSAAEIDTAVDRVLSELSLTEHAQTRIDLLSGGQRKRVGVAAELLHRPSVLFLDEPTTGLDPGLESRTMELLRRLADNSRAVGVVTHATKNLDLCDKLVVMGRGGELSYYGPPEDAAAFFGVHTYDDIYTALDERPATEWRRRFEERTDAGATAASELRRRAQAIAHQTRHARERVRARRRRRGPQTRVLAHRYVKLFARDRRNLIVLLGQVPLLALALVGLFKANVFQQGAGEPNQAAQVLFLLVTIAIWLGSIDASREIIKERSVLEREVAVGVRLSAYLLSKVAVLFTLAAFQTLLLLAIVLGLRPLHESAGAYAEVVGILVLTSFVAIAMGLVVSALVKSEDQATSFIPLVLIPQLLFAGALVPVAKMSDPVKTLSSLIFAQWSYAGVGTAVDMNERIAADPAYSKVSGYGPSFFDIPATSTCLILGGFLVALLASVELLLRSRGI
jgi:ABC transport system ATP-binding/permease protein